MKSLALAIVFALATTMPLVTANASTATVMAYPTQNVSNLIINDTVLAILQYPSGSFISKSLQGRNYSISYSAFASGPSTPLLVLQRALRKYDPNITVINATVTMVKALSANSTTLVFRRSSLISVWVSGIFNKTAAGAVGNFKWKAFRVDEPLYFSFGGNFQGNEGGNYNGNEQDINYFGGDFFEGMGVSFLGDLGGMIPEFSTINFSEFNTPLSQWNRVYDASKNITYFTRSSPTQVLYSASLTVNGQTFSIHIVSDPSYTIGVQGYAVAQGNTIVVSPSPPTNYMLYSVAAATVAVIGVATYLAYRRRR